MKYNYYAKKNDSKFKKKIYHTMNFKINEEGYKVCPQCPVKSDCTKAPERKVRVNYILQEMQDKVDENLLTPQGKEMKRQRSIQVEGTFGIIKQDIGYERIRRRGSQNVKVEIFLVLIGFNLRKYHNKKQRIIN